MTDHADRVVVGRLGKPHGVRGEVVLHPERDDLSLFASGASFATEHGTLVVDRVRRHHGAAIVGFSGVADRTAAEALRGTELRRPRAEVPLDRDEWWASDLVGCVVEDRHGEQLGTVVDVVEGVAQDRLVVEGPSGRVEIPFVDALVPEVHAADRRVVVDLPEGWWGEAPSPRRGPPEGPSSSPRTDRVRGG